jgi:hypothetical protein
MNNLNKHYMKKLIVIFLLLCSGVIYFIGSGCTGDDGCSGKPISEISGPTVDNCATVPVPVSDFQAEVAQFYVGDTVKFRFTGSGMDEVPGSGRNCIFEWWFLGSAQGITLWFMSEDDKIKYHKYSEVGTTQVKLVCSNGCWFNTKVKTYTVTLRPGKDGKPDNPTEINTIIVE